MARFNATRGGPRLRLDEAETDVLRQLVGELRGVLQGGRTDRGDPVYDRLFPAAYEDAFEEAKYVELIGDDLVTQKIEGLTSVQNALGSRATDVTLEGDSLDTWLAALTDLRLAIGTRLEVTEETMSDELDPDAPDAPAMAVLHWLGWLQEGVIRAAGQP